MTLNAFSKRALSFETTLRRLSFLALTIVAVLCGVIAWEWQLDGLELTTLCMFVIGGSALIHAKINNMITSLLSRISLQIESIGNEEFNSWHLAGFDGGQIAQLRSDIDRVSQQLARRQREYMQNEAVLFEFIDQLSLPVMIIDHHHAVYSANEPMKRLYPDAPLIGSHTKKLGIGYQDGQWLQQQSSVFKHRFDIAHRIFQRNGRAYQMLVFISVEARLRDNEKQVWQRLMRVINHEVRNSLTPIYSMTESLIEMKQRSQEGKAPPLSTEQEINLLNVVEKRTRHLLSFVENYSVFSKIQPANKSQIGSDDLNCRLSALFPEITIVQPINLTLNVDVAQIEQVLINLIKNAIEASSDATSIEIHWQQIRESIIISIFDDGEGVANADNLFVPFYTTKPGGSGIGLVLSRELVRNHGGDLTLENRIDNRGAVARIILPA